MHNLAVVVTASCSIGAAGYPIVMHSYKYCCRNCWNPPSLSYCEVWTSSWNTNGRAPQQSERMNMPYLKVRPAVSGEMSLVASAAARRTGCTGMGILGTLNNLTLSRWTTPIVLASAIWAGERSAPSRRIMPSCSSAHVQASGSNILNCSCVIILLCRVHLTLQMSDRSANNRWRQPRMRNPKRQPLGLTGNHFLVASILTRWFTGCFCLELWPSSNAPLLPPQFLPSLRHSFCVWLSWPASRLTSAP